MLQWLMQYLLFYPFIVLYAPVLRSLKLRPCMLPGLVVFLFFRYFLPNLSSIKV